MAGARRPRALLWQNGRRGVRTESDGRAVHPRRRGLLVRVCIRQAVENHPHVGARSQRRSQAAKLLGPERLARAPRWRARCSYLARKKSTADFKFCRFTGISVFTTKDTKLSNI